LKNKLLGRDSVVITSNNIQQEVVDFAKSRFNIFHNPETFAREWRDFKKDNDVYKIEEIELPKKSKQKHYKVYVKV